MLTGSGNRCRPLSSNGRASSRSTDASGKLSVKMREQSAAARRLPFQLVAESIGVDSDQHEVALVGKPLGRGFRRLLGNREMDEAVAAVRRGAAVCAGLFGIAPLGGGADFVDPGSRRFILRRARDTAGSGRARIIIF